MLYGIISSDKPNFTSRKVEARPERSKIPVLCNAVTYEGEGYLDSLYQQHWITSYSYIMHTKLLALNSNTECVTKQYALDRAASDFICVGEWKGRDLNLNINPTAHGLHSGGADLVFERHTRTLALHHILIKVGEGRMRWWINTLWTNMTLNSLTRIQKTFMFFIP